jgi:hypothetical protein
MCPNRCSELLPGTEADISVLTAGYFEAHAINTDQSTLAGHIWTGLSSTAVLDNPESGINHS